jgi:proton glutamate symport protein
MKRRMFALIALAVLSVFLGLASSWHYHGTTRIYLTTLHGLVLFVSLVLFSLILPRRFGIPMQIFIAMVLGVLVGAVFQAWGQTAFVEDYLGIFGSLFISLLKVVVIPLIFVSIVCGVAGIGDVRKLGSVGVKSLAYYLCTTAIAVAIGLTCVNLLQPGKGRESLQPNLAPATEQDASANREESIGAQIQTQVLPQIIQNPVMADQSPLVIIFFALLLGAALAAKGESALPAVRVFQSLDGAFITIVLWVMALAPIGVYALMSNAVAILGLGYIMTLAKYFFTVLLGLVLHFAFLSFVLCPVAGAVSPIRFLRAMGPAFEVAFSTSSSTATLPITIECTVNRAGADRNISNFMLPIGATVNMDGTALYVTVASLFIAQVYGMHLDIQAQVMVFLTAVMVSIGTAGIPGASIGLMSIILSSSGIPLEGIGIIIGVDRFLDMCRTVVNITGDSVGTVVVSHSEGLLREPSA